MDPGDSKRIFQDSALNGKTNITCCSLSVTPSPSGDLVQPTPFRYVVPNHVCGRNAQNIRDMLDPRFLKHSASISQSHSQTPPKVSMLKFGYVSFDFGLTCAFRRSNRIQYAATISILRLNIETGMLRLSSCILSFGRGWPTAARRRSNLRHIPEPWEQSSCTAQKFLPSCISLLGSGLSSSHLFQSLGIFTLCHSRWPRRVYC